MMTPEMADMPMNFSRSLHEKSDCFRHSYVADAECCCQAQHSAAGQQHRKQLVTSLLSYMAVQQLGKPTTVQQQPLSRHADPTNHST